MEYENRVIEIRPLYDSTMVVRKVVKVPKPEVKVEEVEQENKENNPNETKVEQ